MQYQKLTKEQKRIKRQRDKRNKLVCKLQTEFPNLSSKELLKLAYKKLNHK